MANSKQNSLNTDKTKIILFRAPRKPLTRKMNFRISGQRIKVKTCAKYLGIIIDEFLNWKSHFNVLRTKLGRSIGLLSKIRYFVSANLLRTIYFAIFDSTFLTGAGVNFGVKIRMLAQRKYLTYMANIP